MIVTTLKIQLHVDRFVSDRTQRSIVPRMAAQEQQPILPTAVEVDLEEASLFDLPPIP